MGTISSEKKRDVELFSHKKTLCCICTVWLLWIALNACLYCLAADGRAGNPLIYFYPFNYGGASGLWAYDWTELVIYALLLPMLIVAMIMCAYQYCNAKARRRCVLLSAVFAAYCFLLASGAFIGSPALTGILVTMLKAACVFVAGWCIASCVIGFFIRNRTRQLCQKP